MRILAVAAMLWVIALTAVAWADEGHELYQEYCSSCHGEAGQGSRNAPSLIGRPAAYVHFMLDTGRMPAAAPWVNTIHKSPRFTYLQMQEIVAYVASFTPGGIDMHYPQIGPGNIARGRDLFAENCQHCHGAAGNGASVGYNLVAPSLMHASVFQVGEAIRVGPQNMPRFGTDVLSDQDVNDIARYVNYLQTQSETHDATNAGGFSLAHIGPVAEGIIAWICGIGVLMLFVRKIGTPQ